MEEYRRDGFTVFRNLVPEPLVTRLLAQSHIARELVRARRIDMDQPDEDRLQPVWAYDDHLDLEPFTDFVNAPELKRAARLLLSRRHVAGAFLGLLVEPNAGVDCLSWHRDVRALWINGFDEVEFQRRSANPRLLSQHSVPLLPDSSFWIVPGSANRGDTEHERSAARELASICRKAKENGAWTQDSEALQVLAAKMPGSVRVMLEPGDVMFYRAGSWHLSIKSADVPRATLIDRFQCLTDIRYHTKVTTIIRAASGSTATDPDLVF